MINLNALQRALPISGVEAAVGESLVVKLYRKHGWSYVAEINRSEGGNP